MFTVPIGVGDYRWDNLDLQRYEQESIRRFCEALDEHSGVTLFDCGADIGTFSAKVCSESASIGRIFAFEPNEQVTDILLRNMRALPVETQVLRKAVGNLDGSGSLVRPEYDDSAHACFIAPGQGNVEIMRIDALGRSDKHVAFKIDVEGCELEVLQGATHTIRAADTATIVFEAHPRVAQRIGRDPVVCARFLSTIRPFRFTIAETGESLEIDRDLFDVESNSVVNILCKTI
jgi:FkbM family methyltransferase